jgi:formate dehydrogenase iron-sulfur subunit
MYVLHHNDQPGLYAGLPQDPKISSVVEAWKGPFKAGGLAAIAIASVGFFFHHVTKGPNEVRDEDEAHADELKSSNGR